MEFLLVHWTSKEHKCPSGLPLERLTTGIIKGNDTPLGTVRVLVLYFHTHHSEMVEEDGHIRRSKKDRFRSRMEVDREEEDCYSFPKRRKQEPDQYDFTQLPLPSPPLAQRRPRPAPRLSSEEEDDENDEDSQITRPTKRLRQDGEISWAARSQRSEIDTSLTAASTGTSSSTHGPPAAEVTTAALYASSTTPSASKRWHDDEANYSDVNRQLRDLHMERKSRQHFVLGTMKDTLPPPPPAIHAIQVQTTTSTAPSPSFTNMQMSPSFPIPPSFTSTPNGVNAMWTSTTTMHRHIQGGMQDRYAKEYERIKLEEERAEAEAEAEAVERRRTGR